MAEARTITDTLLLTESATLDFSATPRKGQGSLYSKMTAIVEDSSITDSLTETDTIKDSLTGL